MLSRNTAESYDDQLEFVADHFSIHRDGRVKKIHAGFASPTSGPFHRELTEELAQALERLLAENDGGAVIGSPRLLG
ncbi:MAG: hypothetical protein ACLP7Q_07775 [Isosphaeraceae bacterium]